MNNESSSETLGIVSYMTEFNSQQQEKLLFWVQTKKMTGEDTNITLRGDKHAQFYCNDKITTKIEYEQKHSHEDVKSMSDQIPNISLKLNLL